MSESTNPVESIDKLVAKKKRSLIERSLVWTGIIVLLAVVVLEWTSRRNYETTLDELDIAIRGYKPDKAETRILAPDLDRYVRGVPFRGHFSHGVKEYHTFRWPSLFRFYKLIVLIDGHGTARTVDAFSPERHEPAH